MQNPKFSIIIPVYNVEKFIARALESAINQSFEDIEIICVDDCGGDKSMDIVREFAARDKRIKIVQNPQNLGTFMARNNGALAASGEYLFFLDSDDFLHKDACLKCFELLQGYESGDFDEICKNGEFAEFSGSGAAQNADKNLAQNSAQAPANKAQSRDEKAPKIDFIMFNLLAQECKDGAFVPRRVAKSSQIISVREFEGLYFGEDSNFYSIWTKCVRKETYLKALEFAAVKDKILVAEDILASAAIVGVSERVALLDEALYHYCYNESSATRATEKKQERTEGVELVISHLARLATKGDEAYGVFVRALVLVLRWHILGNEMQPLLDLYRTRLARGYPKFIARGLLSLGKRRLLKGQDKAIKRRLREFVKENKGAFFGSGG